MRVLFIIHQFLPEFAAGTESVTMNLARRAQAGGHYVEILTRSTRHAALWDSTDAAGLRHAMVQGVRVNAIADKTADPLAQYGFGRDPAVAQATRAFLDARPTYDVVHITHALRMIEAAEVVRERGLPYVITLTDFFLDCYRVDLMRPSGDLCDGAEGGRNCIAFCPLGLKDAEMLDRQVRTGELLEGAAAVNACSEYVAALFRREHPRLSIRVVNHGIDLLRFGPGTPREAEAEIVFGYIGTISESKGVHVLAEAFAKAAPANARLELIGPCFEEAFLATLHQSLDLTPNMTLREPIPASAVPGRLARFNVLCLPSLSPETFSLAIYEGFAAGLPCLVSDLGWPGHLVGRDGCGQAIPPGDVSAWSAAITDIARDPGRLEAWRERLPLPRRVEEEGFIYDQLYKQAVLSTPKLAFSQRLA